MPLNYWSGNLPPFTSSIVLFLYPMLLVPCLQTFHLYALISAWWHGCMVCAIFLLSIHFASDTLSCVQLICCDSALGANSIVTNRILYYLPITPFCKLTSITFLDISLTTSVIVTLCALCCVHWFVADWFDNVLYSVVGRRWRPEIIQDCNRQWAAAVPAGWFGRRQFHASITVQEQSQSETVAST